MDYLFNSRIEFYNNTFSFSLEDKIRNLVGEVCFYNGGKKEAGITKKKIFSIDELPRSAKYLNPKNKQQINAWIIREFLYAMCPHYTRIVSENPINFKNYF